MASSKSPAIWTVKLSKNGGTTLRRDRVLLSDKVYDRAAAHEVRVRVSVDGALQVHIDGQHVFDVPLAYPASEPRMMGVFVKDASVELTNAAVELFP